MRSPTMDEVLAFLEIGETDNLADIQRITFDRRGFEVVSLQRDPDGGPHVEFIHGQAVAGEVVDRHEYPEVATEKARPVVV